MTNCDDHSNPAHSAARGSAHRVTAEYGEPDEASARKVVVDFQTGTITFFRCHHQDRLAAVAPDPQYSCELHELRGICATWVRPRHVGPVFEVITPSGRARLPHAMRGFNDVRLAVEQAIERSGRRLAWYEHAAAREAMVLALGALGAAVVVAALVAAPHWIGATFVGVTTLLILAVCGWYWRSKRTWW